VWIYIDQAENEMFVEATKEIDETASDRAAAIVAATLVEDHLTRLLRWNLEHDGKALDQLFLPGRALGEFGVKIDLGYLMGLYSKPAKKELDTIRRVRNAFAHRMEVRDFTHDEPRERSNNLKLWESQEIKISAPEGLKVQAKLVMTIGQRLEVGERETLMFPAPTAATPITSRERFVTACKFYIAIVTVAICVSSNFDAHCSRERSLTEPI
jgi:hypothetical protein